MSFIRDIDWHHDATNNVMPQRSAVGRGPQTQGRIPLRHLCAALIALLLHHSPAVADTIRWQDLYSGFVMTRQ